LLRLSGVDDKINEWVWNTSGILLTSEDGSTRKKPVLVPFCPPKILQALALDGARAAFWLCSRRFRTL